jgi:hypothetical protein
VTKLTLYSWQSVHYNGDEASCLEFINNIQAITQTLWSLMKNQRIQSFFLPICMSHAQPFQKNIQKGWHTCTYVRCLMSSLIFLFIFNDLNLEQQQLSQLPISYLLLSYFCLFLKYLITILQEFRWRGDLRNVRMTRDDLRFLKSRFLNF